MKLFKRFRYFHPVGRDEQHLIKPAVRSNYPPFDEDFKTLDEKLMRHFRNFDNEAKRKQNWYRWVYVILIFGGALTTILGIVQIAFIDNRGIGYAASFVALVLAAVTTLSIRFNDQLNFYQARHGECSQAHLEAIFASIGLVFLAGVAGIVASNVPNPGLKLVFFLFVAILPVLSMALAAYSALYAFAQQAKLNKDTLASLHEAYALTLALKYDMAADEFSQQVDDSIRVVEHIFQVEQGQWGQLAEQMRPVET